MLYSAYRSEIYLDLLLQYFNDEFLLMNDTSSYISLLIKHPKALQGGAVCLTEQTSQGLSSPLSSEQTSTPGHVVPELPESLRTPQTLRTVCSAKCLLGLTVITERLSRSFFFRVIRLLGTNISMCCVCYSE